MNNVAHFYQDDEDVSMKEILTPEVEKVERYWHKLKSENSNGFDNSAIMLQQNSSTLPNSNGGGGYDNSTVMLQLEHTTDIPL